MKYIGYTNNEMKVVMMWKIWCPLTVFDTLDLLKHESIQAFLFGKQIEFCCPYHIALKTVACFFIREYEFTLDNSSRDL